MATNVARQVSGQNHTAKRRQNTTGTRVDQVTVAQLRPAAQQTIQRWLKDVRCGRHFRSGRFLPHRKHIFPERDTVEGDAKSYHSGRTLEEESVDHWSGRKQAPNGRLLACPSNAARSRQAEQPTGGRTENTVTTKLSVQHHLSVGIEEQPDDLSPVADALQQPLQQEPLLVHENGVPMAPATIGDLNLGSPGPELPQRSIIVHSSSSVCACSELSFEGPAEGVRGCTQEGRSPPPVVVDNEPAHQLPGILHTTRSAVLCRTVTMKADDCRKVDSGSNVLEIQEARDIANSLSHKHESVRPGMPGEWSFQVRQVPPPATVPSGVTISWGGNTTDVVHRQADDMLAAEKPGPQSAAHHDEVNQGNVGDQKPTSLNWTSPASEINTDVNTKKLPDRPGASVTSYHTTGEKVPGSKIQDVQEELKVQVSSARSPDSIHLESRIQRLPVQLR
ncbi:hypothetical protein HPB48_005680 [Haemaphysalis longicornis]|uniref:Uncharacterized protein n=1 Tax=Haemaphysalis longicornis TaxID=44386 RepID=A0A9J6GL17_HAELO|nr:hypothetical protein HPB48_005680 [Haemaphysalis longicornis]